MEFNKYELQKSRVKNVIKAYSRMMLNNNVDWIKLKNIYNRTIKDNYAEYNVKKILKQRTAQLMVTEELIKITEEHGITAKEALEKRDLVLRGAIKDRNWNAANKALDAFDDKLDLQPQKVTVTKTIEGDMSHYLPDHAKGKLKAKEKRVEESND